MWQCTTEKIAHFCSCCILRKGIFKVLDLEGCDFVCLCHSLQWTGRERSEHWGVLQCMYCAHLGILCSHGCFRFLRSRKVSFLLIPWHAFSKQETLLSVYPVGTGWLGIGLTLQGISVLGLTWHVQRALKLLYSPLLLQLIPFSRCTYENLPYCFV